MYSKHHFAISVVLGAAVGLLVPAPLAWPGLGGPLDWLLLAAYAGVLGTAIDVDHFLVARLNGGTWRPLVRVVRRPHVAFLDQDAIFAPDDLWGVQRLLSHLVIAGVLVAVLLPVSVFLAVFSALVLYAHVLADLVWDVLHRRETFELHAAAVAGASVTDDPSTAVATDGASRETPDGPAGTGRGSGSDRE